jgi:hypothetical protein
MNLGTLPQVHAEVAYLAKMAEKPHSYAYDLPPGQPRTNMLPDVGTVPIHDMRPMGGDMSLDGEGFALITAPTEADDPYDEDQLRRVCYPEAERIIADATGGNRVVVFDHTIRRRTPDIEDRTPGIPRQPVTRIHGDHTEISGPRRIRELMGDDAGGKTIARKY